MIRFRDVLALFVHARRIFAGQTQAELADIIGVNERQLRAAENKQYISRPALFRIAAWCNLNDELESLGGQPDADMASRDNGVRGRAAP